MRISNKIIAAVGIVVLIILLIFYPLQEWWMTGSFDSIERQKVESEFNHTTNGINFDLASLQSVARDYADWDDTYSFVQNYSEQYVTSNLVEGSFVNQRLSVIVIANSTGGILYARGYDHERDNLMEIPKSLASRLGAGSPLLPLPGNSTLGLVALPEGFMMVSAVPVLKSDLTGPPMGTLIMGRYLDAREIGIIESISGTQMSLLPWDAGSGPAPGGPLQIKNAGNDSVAGQGVISDIYGQPAAVLSISLPRPFLAEEQAGQWFNAEALIGASVLGCLIFLVLIEWTVLSPMRKLSDSVARIGRDQDLTQRVPVAGHDELSLLAGTINRTLDALEGSRQQLQDKEQRFRTLVENINDVVWEADSDLKLTYVSPQAMDVLGYRPDELLGRSPFELLDAGDRERIQAIIHDKIVRRGSFALVEFPIVRPHGGRTEIEVGGNAILDAAGAIVRYRGIARDIGERKRAETALRESEERLRLCAATARFGTFDWDLVNDRHLWSPETYAIYGLLRDAPLTLDDITGQIYPGDRKDAALAAGLDPAGPGEYEMEYRIVRASDGAVRWVYVKGRVFFAGEGAERKAVRVLGAIQDITERKRAEEALLRINDELESRVQQRTAELRSANAALQENERKYRELVQYANSMIIRFDMEGRILYFNEFACRFFGYEHDEIIGLNVLDTIVPRTEPSGRDPFGHMKDLLKHPDQYETNVNENVRRNGERAWVSWTNKAFLGPDGRIAGILAIGNDITDLKRASEELKHVNDTLEFRVQQRTEELASAVKALQAEVAERKRIEAQIKSSLQEKDVLLKEIHHRVKNNLQIISSLLSLQAETIGSENPAQTFRESQDRIRSMALIHEKLYQAHDISRVDFGEYVRSLTAYLARSYINGHAVRINVDIAEVSLGIDTAIPCGLIINELVSNALKYAFSGGRQGEIRISLARGGDTYTLVVADNGAGLPPDLDFRKTRTLGLQLVHTLVDQLEGTIELGSGTAGTMIRITFPASSSNSEGPSSL